MDRRRKVGRRYGSMGFLLSALLGFAMYQAVSMHGHKSVIERVESEAALVVDITASFANTYSAFGARYTDGGLPPPASFRAEALKHVRKGALDDERFSTSVVGLPGKEIAQYAKDDAMRQQLFELEASPSTKMVSSILESNGDRTHRSLWAFPASQQSCADCHNKLQGLTGSDQWQVGELMGAQVVEQSIEPQLTILERSAMLQAILLFAAVLASWFWCIYLINQSRLTGEFKKLATIDPLTGCINRRELHNRVAKLKGRTNGALLMLDLDRFKQINDTYGHDKGDEVICDFTRRMQNTLRSDDWVARFGGEEFLVWLPDIKPDAAMEMAERLRGDVEQAQVSTEDSTITYTVSIGLYIVQNAMPSRFEGWIKAADKLVYRAKMEGRNRIAYGVSTTA